jgi:hypothetical protein
MDIVNWDNAFEGATHALTTGKYWDGDSECIGFIALARKVGDKFFGEGGSEFRMGASSWVVLEERPKPESDNARPEQIGGNHYGNGIDVFKWSLERKHDCLQHAAIKYIDRHHLKNGVDDINKAISVLERIKFEQYGNK